MKWTVIYEPGDDQASWNAYTPDLPVFVAGESRDEVEHLIREGVAFHLDGLREDGLPLPTPHCEVGQVDVAA